MKISNSSPFYLTINLFLFLFVDRESGKEVKGHGSREVLNHLPLSGRVVYLDLPGQRGLAVFEGNLKLLGAVSILCTDPGEHRRGSCVAYRPDNSHTLKYCNRKFTQNFYRPNILFTSH